MSAFGAVIGLLKELVGWGREERKAAREAHDAAVMRKAEIDSRHVERRDLSKDKRPR